MTIKAKYDRGYDLQVEGDRQILRFKGAGMNLLSYVIAVPFYGLLVVMIPTPLFIVPLILIPLTGRNIWKSFKQQEFVLTETGITLGGKEYDHDKIVEFILDNPMDTEATLTSVPGMVAGGTGIAGSATAATTMMAGAAVNLALGIGEVSRRGAAKRTFRIRMRYGARLVTLAHNLREDQALAIFRHLTEG